MHAPPFGALRRALPTARLDCGDDYQPLNRAGHAPHDSTCTCTTTFPRSLLPSRGLSEEHLGRMVNLRPPLQGLSRAVCVAHTGFHDWHSPQHRQAASLEATEDLGEEDMRDTKKRGKPRKRRGASPEPRVVSIEFNPGPDAEDRLRRVFTIPVNHAMTRRQSETEK